MFPAYKKKGYNHPLLFRSFSVSFHLSSQATKGAEAFLLLYTSKLAMLDIIGNRRCLKKIERSRCVDSARGGTFISIDQLRRHLHAFHILTYGSRYLKDHACSSPVPNFFVDGSKLRVFIGIVSNRWNKSNDSNSIDCYFEKGQVLNIRVKI